MMASGIAGKKVRSFILDNIVTIIFVAFILIGMLMSKDVTLSYFLNELSERVFRNSFLVLSLIIPVIAGLGMNFGIVIGAMAGQIAIVTVRYFGFGGFGGLMLCFLIAFPLAVLFGYFTGLLYNRTRGQEMIASLIVSYFANGIYQFLFLFVVGVIIPVAADHPLIKPDGVGVRMTVDLGAPAAGGMKYALDNIIQIPFMTLILIVALCALVYLVIRFARGRKNPILGKMNGWIFGLYCAVCVAAAGVSAYAIITGSPLMKVRKAPLVTALIIVALCLFTQYLMKTKLGQDFRSVGQNQHIAEVSGINVDRTRIIATIISTVLASWGMIIFLQNMGTLSTYTSHTQIGMFSVASLLVGGASTSKAGVKHAIIGVVLFNAMFIMSPEIGKILFGDPGAGEYFRTFMVYGVIGLALGLYVWKAIKAAQNEGAL